MPPARKPCVHSLARRLCPTRSDVVRTPNEVEEMRARLSLTPLPPPLLFPSLGALYDVVNSDALSLVEGAVFDRVYCTAR